MRVIIKKPGRSLEWVKAKKIPIRNKRFRQFLLSDYQLTYLLFQKHHRTLWPEYNMPKTIGWRTSYANHYVVGHSACHKAMRFIIMREGLSRIPSNGFLWERAARWQCREAAIRRMMS